VYESPDVKNFIRLGIIYGKRNLSEHFEVQHEEPESSFLTLEAAIWQINSLQIQVRAACPKHSTTSHGLDGLELLGRHGDGFLSSRDLRVELWSLCLLRSVCTVSQ